MSSSSPSTSLSKEEEETALDLDISDQEILLLVTKGYTSSYAIWSAMKKAANESGLGKKVMTYRNNNKRVIKLARLGLIEEIKPDTQTVNIHGRKDYKVTKKGFEYMISYIMPDQDDVKVIIEYMDKFGLSKEIFAERLFNRVASEIRSTDEYLRYGKPDPLSILNADSITQLQRRMFDLSYRLKIMQNAITANSTPQLSPKAKLLKQKESINPKTSNRIRISELMDEELEEDLSRMDKSERHTKTIASQKKKR